MKKSLIKRLEVEGIVDTRKYRYKLSDGVVLRIELSKLNTTEAIDGWEFVSDLWERGC